MKNLRKIAQFTAAALCLFAFSTVAMGATVSGVVGGVQIKRGADAAWEKAKNGDALSAGTVVWTKAGASCVVKWGRGGVMKISPLAMIDIDSLDTDTAGKETTAMRLKIGKVSAHVEKMTTGSTFVIKTPSAIAGVRGTDFFGEVREDNSSSFGVTDGEIYVAAGDIEIVVAQDFMLNVTPSGEIGEPAPIPDEIKQEMKEEMKEMKEAAKEEEVKKSGDAEKEPEAKTNAVEEKEVVSNAVVEEPAAPNIDQIVEDAISKANDDIVNNVIQNEITEQAIEEYLSGSVTVDIYLQQ